jgi:hypothetical protein
MLYEVREYTALPGRLPVLIDRFNNTTLRLFRKHGMDVVFLGRTDSGEDSKNEVVYTLRFDSYADMENRWSSFLNDPEWKEAAARSEQDGPLVARIRRRFVSTTGFTGPTDG